MPRGWIFFDIDGTLLHAHRVGREAFPIAFYHAFGWEQGVEHINFFGATDLGVLRRVAAERCEILTPEMERKFFNCLAPAVEERLAQHAPEVFVNVKPLLQTLAADWNLGIITGNILPTARSKLKYAGLLEFFDRRGFGCGGYEDRAEIARCVLARIGNPARCILIGDTPNDIFAAKKNNMSAVAVATGGFYAPALHAAGADLVLNDFSNAAPLFELLEHI